VILQAAGLALLAALQPTPLLVVAVYLGSARPRFTAAIYLVGAVVVSLVMGVVVLAVVRGAGLNVPAEHAPRYGLRLGLGIVLVVAGIVMARRKPAQPDPAGAQGIVSRMMADPTPLSAFGAGIVVFASGLPFLAAVQVIATARASLWLTAVAVIVVIAVYVMLAWLPIVLHMAAPGATTRYLTAFNGWLRAHGSAVAVWVLVVVGAIMIGNGVYGLTAG
jgi:Sap, sulfolipid-1-addressing protein